MSSSTIERKTCSSFTLAYFAAASRAWLRAGWDAKYVYGFTWFGRPVIQLPDDLVRHVARAFIGSAFA